MKYLLVGLIVPVIPVLVLILFMIGAIVFGLENLRERSKPYTSAYKAAKQNAQLHDARKFRRI